MRRHRIPPLLTAAVALVALAVALVLLAPVQVGGRTGYVVTAGTSMEPSIHAGDLVITRARGTYEVGDVVLYRSATLDRDVLHRIVARDGARFVLEGDNNGYRDADRPGADRIVGEQWLRVPAVGGLLAWLKRPPVFAALAFLLAFGLIAGGRATTGRGDAAGRAVAAPGGDGDRTHSSAAASSVAVGALAALTLFAAIGVAAWTRPTERDATVPNAWAHTGAFSYGAEVPRSAVYPSGIVTTGDAVFTRLVRRLDVGFDYRFDARSRSDLHGAIRLDAVVSDGQGWSRRLPLAPAEPFTGPAATVRGSLDLRAVRSLVERMRRLTGSPATQFTLAFTPVVELAGYTGATVLDERYAPTLPLVLDATGVRPAQGENGAQAVFGVRESGSATASVPAAVGLGPVAVSVEHGRVLGVLGVIVSLLAAGLALALALRSRPDARDRAMARFGRRLVESSTVAPDSRWVTDVGGIDELARIAEHFDRMVLHTVVDGRDVFLVDDGVAVYRVVLDPAVARESSAVAVPAGGR